MTSGDIKGYLVEGPGFSKLFVQKAFAQAKAALEPFAAYTTADGIDGGAPFLRIPDNHPILFNGLGDNAKAVVLVKHFRASRTALAAMKGEDNAE